MSLPVRNLPDRSWMSDNIFQGKIENFLQQVSDKLTELVSIIIDFEFKLLRKILQQTLAF